MAMLVQLIDDVIANKFELRQGTLEIGRHPASDIFSLAVTFFQLLSGELPFHGDNIAGLSYQIIHGKHKNIRDLRSQIPTSASRIINKALQKEPGDRYGNATDMARSLRKALQKDFA